MNKNPVTYQIQFDDGKRTSITPDGQSTRSFVNEPLRALFYAEQLENNGWRPASNNARKILENLAREWKP